MAEKEKENEQNITEPKPQIDDSNDPKDVCSAQWMLLWTTAAYAPQNPTPEEEESLRTFYLKFQDQCRQGPLKDCYKEALERGPPPGYNSRQLALWLCLNENKCRQKHGLPLKQCNYNKLMDRWRFVDNYL